MPEIELTIGQGIAEITLSRPAKRNAISEPMAAQLLAALESAEESGARALVLRGEGEAFCSGRDLSTADPAADDAQAILSGWVNPLITRLAGLAIPTFAAVHGACLGVGLGLALACDVVYAADDALIGSPFARIGAVLDSGGHLLLSRPLGEHRALELIYTGRLLSGEEAAHWGLINRSVPRAELDQQARALAAVVADGPTTALLESKRLMRRVVDEGLGLDEVLALEAAAQGRAAQTADYSEGIGAFQQKRRPRFTGR
ncbi:MAG TPA: enoyl-CoA hydratase-related protein [Egibacteraceae bacterium]|nr:enoyl-CoA hydratase-related protein [Egibacteraceae bacterium]